MSYNFASDGYASLIVRSPGIDVEALRAKALKIVDAFDPESWYTAPLETTLRGKPLRAEGDEEVDTFDAFNRVNGRQVLSPPAVVDRVIAHAKEFSAYPGLDLRAQVRAVEDIFFSGELAPELVAFQTLDFHKQDGLTEIEESVQAIRVERQLNDALFEDEKAGKVAISRKPAFVGCVSNFSNFLDLCRKILRNIEIGVPVIVPSRSNTTQHPYRYVLRLLKLMGERGIDQGLVTYVSCSIQEQRRIFAACEGSPMYFTGSREVASKIKEVLPKLMASTGGPNTMVVGPGKFTSEVANAVRMSNMIEHKGQCTALRHAVVAGGTVEDLHTVFKNQPNMPSAGESLRNYEFSAALKPLAKPVLEGYTTIPAGSGEVAVRHCGERPPREIDERWREAYLDLTTPKALDAGFLEELAAWLNREQPITLSMNCDYEAALELFENTALVVYTVGDVKRNVPALSCQARPQDGECFGEFPPRRQLEEVTHFPVVVPSSTPSYNTSYTEAFLKAHGAGLPEGWGLPSAVGDCVRLVNGCSGDEAKGYCRVLLEYLADAASGPRRGCGDRTALFGWQRPPARGGDCCIRVESVDCFDEAIQLSLPFIATNARPQLVLSADPELAGPSALKAMRLYGVRVVFESAASYEKSVGSYWNTVRLPRSAPSDPQYPMAAQFVSRLLPLGHIKSVHSDDKEFVEAFSASSKWLRLLTAPQSSL